MTMRNSYRLSIVIAALCLFVSNGTGAQGITALSDKLDLPVTGADYVAYIESAVVGYNTVEQIRIRKLSRFDITRGAVNAFLYENTQKTVYAQRAAAYLLRMADIENGLAGTDAQQFMMTQIDFALRAALWNYDILKDTAFLTASEKTYVADSLGDIASYVAVESLQNDDTTNRNGEIISTAGVARAVEMFPSHPFVSFWAAQVQAKWDDIFWPMGDVDEESSHYNGLEIPFLMETAESTGHSAAFYGDPDFREMFERYLQQASPLGVLPNYGDSDWTVMWGLWVGIFERTADIYQDGRFTKAAHLTFNYARAQGWYDNHPDVLLGLCLAVRYRNPSVAPTDAGTRSYYSGVRWRNDVPDKLVLRNGQGENESFVHMNLLYGGTHGHPDGSAVTCYIDNDGVLLRNHALQQNSEQFRNMLLIRDPAEEFPFNAYQFLPNVWQYSAIELDKIRPGLGHSLNLAALTGCSFRVDDEDSFNVNFDFYVDNIRAHGPGKSVIIADFENGLNGWSGQLSTDCTQGSYALRRSMSFTNAGASENATVVWPSTIMPLDLSGCDTLEFDWKITTNRLDPHWGAMIKFSDARTTSNIRAQFTSWLRTMRRPIGHLVSDYSKAAFGSAEILVKDYLGGQSVHTRDMALAGGRFFWVRDSIDVIEGKHCKIGPVWHVGTVSQSAANWFDVYQDPVDAKKGWRAGARNCLVYFSPNSQCVIGRQQNSNLDPAHAVYQMWQGTPVPGQQLHFNTLFIPHDPGIDPAVLASNIQTLYDSADATAFKLQNMPDQLPDQSAIISISTSQTGRFEAAYGSDARMACLEYDAQDRPIDLAAEQASRITLAGQTLFELSQPGRVNVEIAYTYDPSGDSACTGTLHGSSACTVALFYPRQPSLVSVGAESVAYSYDQDQQLLYFQISEGKNSIRIEYEQTGCQGLIPADLDINCVVDLGDLLRLAENWLAAADPSSGNLDMSDRVDFQDFSIFSAFWGKSTWDFPTACWKMDAHEGAIVADQKGLYDGLLIGAGQWRPGQGSIGGAIELFGCGQYIDIPDFNLGNEWTVSCWIKLKTQNKNMVMGNRANGTDYFSIQDSVGVHFGNTAGQLCRLDDGYRLSGPMAMGGPDRQIG
jgi:hypothetical protein